VSQLDLLSGVIEEKQIDGTWKSTGELATPEYKNDVFSSGIVGFTIADNVRNASTSYPISTPPNASSAFPALSLQIRVEDFRCMKERV
jgi:hypothetical protein